MDPARSHLGLPSSIRRANTGSSYTLDFSWRYQLDALTRKHITIAPCHSTSPDRLRRRFTRLSGNGRSEEEMEVRMIVEEEM
ncbi:hypothetical protein QJS10_CPB04g00486 [Acorus calamus]|uniref:Uncharacterized protein n=1 Tax=Acorus calamus TaxID=4465 RepID=A0AAV9F0R4_ACOCL|nr:hypothetical protein QJS10_CPB04g00486 [Acorus calamus]